VTFWSENRLGFQLKLALEKGCGPRLEKLGQDVLQALPMLLTHNPKPSLLHGDLWAGNSAFDGSCQPIVFDPATYYGDREVDLAMTELFGGFSSEFYRGYEATWPLPKGYSERKTVYNLYHILNHFNTFGGAYATQAEEMMRSILATAEKYKQLSA
jgi:fructosamine-3-kinase